MRPGWLHQIARYVPTTGHALQGASHHVVKGRTPHVEPRGWSQESGRGAHVHAHAARVDEWEQLKLELGQARERIVELTRSQIELTSTIARLTELASTDVLTGLNNRRRFLEALEANFTLAIRQQLTLSVIMLDVDSFKTYNDTYGHSAGDEVLGVVASQLQRHCRNYDVVARYGGEEFAILLPAADPSQAADCAELQRKAIESYPWPLRKVTASFGVSTFRPTTSDPADLVEEADRALYHSKSRGRNRVTHHRNLESARSATVEARKPFDPDSARVKIDAAHTHTHTHRDTSTSPRGEIVVPAATADHRPSTLGLIAESSVIVDAPTDALDRFVQELRDGRKVSHPYRAALSAIQEGTEADLVFLYSDLGGQVLEIVGDHVPMPQWCQRVAQWLLDGLPRGGIWKGFETETGVGVGVGVRVGVGGEPCPLFSGGPEPAAALVYPVEAPRPAWLIVLRVGEDRPFVASDQRLARMVWRLQTDKKRHDHIYDNLKETLFGVVRCLSTAIDAKDPYTCGHSERVARISVRLGKEMQLSSGEISDLYLAGLLHDVGKIGIRDEILCKPGPLDAEEFAHMREHPVIGERIIANVSRLSYIRPGVRGHHERFDGKGYPDRIAGEAIPLMARILAVSDSCDAMMSARRYRPELSQARIEEIFKEGKGTQWDPRIVEYFFACRHDLYAVFQRGLGQSVYTAVERAAGDDSPENRRIQAINRNLAALD